MNLILVPPQLSCTTWTEMRRAEIQYESFIHFTASYAPPNTLESEISTQQLGLMGGLYVPKPAVLLALANQLENLRTAAAAPPPPPPPPEPKASNPEYKEGDSTKDEIPKKVKPVDTGDIPKEASQVLQGEESVEAYPDGEVPQPHHPMSRMWHLRLTGWRMW